MGISPAEVTQADLERARQVTVTWEAGSGRQRLEHILATALAEEREKAFNEGALAGMRLAAEHRKAAKDVQ